MKHWRVKTDERDGEVTACRQILYPTVHSISRNNVVQSEPHAITPIADSRHNIQAPTVELPSS